MLYSGLIEVNLGLFGSAATRSFSVAPYSSANQILTGISLKKGNTVENYFLPNTTFFREIVFSGTDVVFTMTGEGAYNDWNVSVYLLPISS